ncbi:MAG: AraC family transcriptional regulator [Terrimicrobiaceae bacterium]
MSETILSYARDLESSLTRVCRGTARIVIPEAIGLHRRRPGAHFHPTPEVFLQTGGASDFECPSGRFRLKTGDLCIIPAGVPHAEKPRDLRTKYGVIVLMKESDGFIALRAATDSQGRIQSRNVQGFAHGGAAFHCLDQAARATTILRNFRRSYLEGLMAAFLAAILTEMKNPDPRGEKIGSPLVMEAQRMVRVEISRADLSVQAVADRIGCSPDHLTRLFRAGHGMSLGVWIAKERVQLACDLLLHPGHNIAEVAWTCGFSSPSYFIRVFKAYTGATPKAWRIHAMALQLQDGNSSAFPRAGKKLILHPGNL